MQKIPLDNAALRLVFLEEFQEKVVLHLRLLEFVE